MHAAFVVFIVYLAAFVSTFGASIAVGGGNAIIATFQVPESQKSFLVSTYLMVRTVLCSYQLDANL